MKNLLRKYKHLILYIVFGILTFFAARLLTGLLDVAIMYVAVDIQKWDATLWKLLSNTLVIILNYVAGRLLVFRKK